VRKNGGDLTWTGREAPNGQTRRIPMNTKIMAVLMALIMTAAALIASVPGAGAEEGDADDPYYLIGSASAPAALYQSDSDGLTARMDFNETAYTIKSLKFSYSVGSTYQNITVGQETSVNSGDVLVTISSTSDPGVYKLALKYGTHEKSTNLIIKVDITTSYKGSKDLTLSYYYGANVRTIASGHEDTGKDKIAVEELESGKTYLKVTKDENYKTKLWVYNPQDRNKTPIMDTYNFYATGLPDGLAIKADVAADHEFVIAGKVIHNIKADEGKEYKECDVTIYAADINGNILEPKEVKLRVYLSELEFSYEVITEDGTETFDEDVTVVIKAGTTITVVPSNDNVTVIGPDAGEWDAETNTYTSSADESGVIEIIMINEDASGAKVQHKVTALIVGEIVHSGLDPVVTSA
jgi:hypothetical protein